MTAYALIIYTTILTFYIIIQMFWTIKLDFILHMDSHFFHMIWSCYIVNFELLLGLDSFHENLSN
jgi:hypothetical protein